jgi:hypothetical protein
MYIIMKAHTLLNSELWSKYFYSLQIYGSEPHNLDRAYLEYSATTCLSRATEYKLMMITLRVVPLVSLPSDLSAVRWSVSGSGHSEQVYIPAISTFRHPTATESPAFTSSVAQLASAFDC